MHTTSDFSYRNQRLVGHRLLRVGDAAGFMDPIFSAGVYLAMHSGRQAARVVLGALAEGSDGRRQLKRYEAETNRSMRLYWQLVEGYYSKPFLDLFMQPKNKFDIPSAVTAVLGGELQGGWRVRWRMWLFFALVAVQKRWPLLPPISFAPMPPPSPETNEAPASEPETVPHG
jgi:FADH2-dependent halogenase